MIQSSFHSLVCEQMERGDWRFTETVSTPTTEASTEKEGFFLQLTKPVTLQINVHLHSLQSVRHPGFKLWEQRVLPCGKDLLVMLVEEQLDWDTQARHRNRVLPPMRPILRKSLWLHPLTVFQLSFIDGNVVRTAQSLLNLIGEIEHVLHIVLEGLKSQRVWSRVDLNVIDGGGFQLFLEFRVRGFHGSYLSDHGEKIKSLYRGHRVLHARCRKAGLFHVELLSHQLFSLSLVPRKTPLNKKKTTTHIFFCFNTFNARCFRALWGPLPGFNLAILFL